MYTTRISRTVLAAAVGAAAFLGLTGQAAAADPPSVDVVLRTFAPDWITPVVDADDRSFAGSPTIGPFVLDTDATDGDAIGDRADFGLTVGERVWVDHPPVPGYELTDISCNGGDPVDRYQGSTLVGTEVGAVTGADVITCFFDIRQVAPFDLTVNLNTVIGSDVVAMGAVDVAISATGDSAETVALDDVDTDATYPDSHTTVRNALIRHEIRVDVPDRWVAYPRCFGDLVGTVPTTRIFDGGRPVGVAFTAAEAGAVRCSLSLGAPVTVFATASDGAGGPSNLDVGFTGDLGSFTLDAGRSSTNKQQPFLVDPGRYEIYPDIPTGWRLSGMYCGGVSSADSGPITDASGGQVGVWVQTSVDRQASCVASLIVDDGVGDLFIAKRWVDGSNNTVATSSAAVADQVVTFSGDLGPMFIDYDAADSTYQPFADLRDIPAGTYDIVEDTSPAFELRNVRCDPESGVDAATLTDAAGAPVGVRLPISGGDTWYCTFTNRLPFLSLRGFVSGLTAEGSRVVSDDLTLMLHDDAGTPVGTLLADTDTTDGDGIYRDAIFTPLGPGRYTLSATPPAGYEVSFLLCRTELTSGGVTYPTGISNVVYDTDPNGGRRATFDLAAVPNAVAGNLCSVSYRELPTGTLTVVKRTQTSDGRLVTDPDIFTLTSDGAFGTQNVDTDPNSTIADRATVRVPAGAATVTELASPLWSLTDITCTGATPTDVTDSSGRLVGMTVMVPNGGDVTCSFTNTSDVARVLIDKTTLDQAGDRTFDTTPFTFRVGDQTATATGDGRGGLLTFSPGSGTVTEDPSEGWVFVGVSCIDLLSANTITPQLVGDAAFTLDLIAGDRIRCDVVNQLNPDRDGDGVVDPDDNCPDIANADQTDWDRDGIGLACDADDDRLPVTDHRSQGFWKKAFSGRGSAKFDEATLGGLLDAIGTHSVAFAKLDPTDARTILEDRSDMRANATSQALAAWLNWADDGTTFYEEIQPGLRFGDLIDQVEAILADPAADHATLEAAKDLAESVNVRR